MWQQDVDMYFSFSVCPGEGHFRTIKIEITGLKRIEIASQLVPIARLIVGFN